MKISFVKMLKYFVLVLCGYASYSVYAGQGVKVMITNNTNAPLQLKVSSSCVYGAGNVELNKNSYIEANQSGTCFFQKSNIRFEIFYNALLLGNYNLNISAYGSSFTHTFDPLGQNEFIESAQFYPHSGLSNSQDLVEISLSSLVDDWQNQVSPYIANLPLNRVPIPGSHDTGTFNINQSSFTTPDASSFLDFISDTDFHNNIVGWSKTQYHNISQQLERGIRYFDLRVCGQSYDGRIVPVTTCHAVSGASLESIFQAAAHFLANPQHNREIILLDINHVYGVSPSQREEIKNLARTYFGNKIASPKEFSAQSTYQNLWDQNKQIIIFWNIITTDPSLIVSNDDLFWDVRSIFAPWPDKQSLSGLTPALTELVQNRNQNENNFFVLQTQLTPTTKDIVNGVFIVDSPKSLVQYSNYKSDVRAFLSSPNFENQMRSKGNIIIEDFSTGTDLVAYCKKLIYLRE